MKIDIHACGTIGLGTLQNPPCWRASSLLFPHWDSKTKRSEPVELDLPLLLMSQWGNNNEQKAYYFCFKQGLFPKFPEIFGLFAGDTNTGICVQWGAIKICLQTNVIVAAESCVTFVVLLSSPSQVPDDHASCGPLRRF